MGDAEMSIGRFSRLTGLTVKALRHYDAEGLLHPATVDPQTGYRRYEPAQVETGQTIRTLRDFDVPLETVRKFTEAAMWRAQRTLHRLRNLLDDEGGITVTQTTPPTMEADEHRQLGVDLFNGTWTLMEKPDRTPDDDLRMLAMTYASAYHWSQAGVGPEHAARGEWQISRVHTVLGQGESALFHGLASLRLCEEHGIGDWDLAFAHEAVARAYRTLGDGDRCAAEVTIAERLGADIADPESRELLEQDLATLRP